MTAKEVMLLLRAKSNPASLAGMHRFGIAVENALGIPIPELRKLAKQIKTDHQLALELWETKIHEARILASMIDDPAMVTARQFDHWTEGFNSWDVCDQVCGNLLDRTSMAIQKAHEYSCRPEEFVKRAAFVLMAESAVHNKVARDDVFAAFLPLIEREAGDERNFVKKAVNWALRQIGKRNAALNAAAIETAQRIRSTQTSKSARWIAQNALNELIGKYPVTNN